MFEHYTERARRVIFFARYEASAYGSTTIETEHLLLGLLREDKTLTHRLTRSDPETLRKAVEGCITIKPKTSTSIDLPLTDECKRILAYANEEAQRLAHRHIGTEHLLLGILREENCLATQLLRERGLRIDGLREELAKSLADKGYPSHAEVPPADRAAVHAVVDQLPEQVLGRAKWMLEGLL